MEGSSVIVVCLLIFTHTVSGLTSEEKDQFSEDVTLEVDGDVYSFFSSGYPPHDIDNSVNPATAAVKNFTYNITVNPDNEGDQVWCTSLGPVGFATNGVAIYNALTGSTTDAVRYEEFDDCQGHSSPDGAYHYHQFPSCVGTITDVDLFVGVALDGNPIYGPKASDFEELITSADLDACHGRFKDGRYRYHITTDFPYVIGCYKAEPAESAGPGGEGGGQGPPGGGGGQGPPGGGGGQGPPPGRRRRQADQATCTNTEYGAMLCDCTSGSLTECDTLTDDDAHLCPGSTTETTEKNDVDDDGENGSTSIFVPSVTFIAIVTTTISTIV